MTASKNHIDWGLFLLRIAVGGMALLQGLEALRRARLTNVLDWAMDLLQMICGALVLLGLWVPLAGGVLAVLLGWPLVHGWLHGAGLLANLHGLFRCLVTTACALGGAGKWSLGRRT